MTILGALIAGGQSRRFGSDKALALWAGQTLMDHALAALRDCTDELIVCGRSWSGAASVTDRPVAGLGPLGGLNAALHHAEATGHALVLCTPVDVVPLWPNVLHLLRHDGPAVIAEQHVIGLWPSSMASALDAYLADGQRSVRGWIQSSAAKDISQCTPMHNINYIYDLNGS
ncbi:MAG: molybdenum cofactor guanylyltransferase [Zymomonas sp.]|uniref:molybdenum cofactor guanylyltransferase n=1 Tax=Sphingomonas sp. TaxID=28214 RepID=UPI001D7CC778|nr:molybdenum cofactor guanylyltransferase [Zymomonas sp.]